MRFRAAFVTTDPMKATHSNKRSITQNSNRLAAYLATGIGAGLVATPAAKAAIVNIDLTDTGFNLDGVNAGLSPNSSTTKPNFPISGGGTLLAANSLLGMGFYGQNNLYFAAGSSAASPVNFTLNQSISSSANWAGYPKSLFKDMGTVSPDFGSGSYMGFKTAQGNLGWLEVTWSGATDTFQVYSGAYESDIGVTILAGDTGGGGSAAVPEPAQVASSLLLLALGSAGVAIQRRRAKKKQAAAVA
jgi:hypothetical protein